jgi:hypothetical protein
MFGTPASVAGLAALTYTIEYEGSGFLEVDCPSVSFDLTHLDSRGARAFAPSAQPWPLTSKA